jgi:hypothetical protein
MLRYHAFYAAHRHGAYRHLMNAHDEQMFDWRSVSREIMVTMKVLDWALS